MVKVRANPMNFEFTTATRIVFGPGKISSIGKEAAKLGKRAFVILGKSQIRARRLLEELNANEIKFEMYSVSGEPTVEIVQEGVERARQFGCDLVIGFGGGSVLDTGKAISILMTNIEDIYMYLEVIGEGKPFAQPGFPYIAIPTTAGTGTEVTKNAVIGAPDHHVKVSLRGEYLLPRLALVDPMLTYDLPPEVTASTGLDALTQLIEPFVCNQPNPIVDALCREGIPRISRSLRKAFQQGNDPIARLDLSLASLFSGLALANAKLGAVHGFAGPIGGMFPVPHGVVCGLLLPHVMEINIRSLQNREKESVVLHRYSEVAKMLTGIEGATVDEGLIWLKELCSFLGLPGLSSFGVTEKDFIVLVEKSAKASSMKGNPIQLTEADLYRVLELAL